MSDNRFWGVAAVTYRYKFIFSWQSHHKCYCDESQHHCGMFTHANPNNCQMIDVGEWIL